MGLLRRWFSGARLADVYVVFYLGMLLIWPYTSYDRFLLPLLPFLLLYTLTQVRRFLPARAPGNSKKAPGTVATTVFIGVLALVGSSVVFGYIVGLLNMTKGQKIYKDYAQLEQPALDWIAAHTAPTDVILSYRDPRVYLYTGRRSTRSIMGNPREFYTGGSPLDSGDARIIFDLIRYSHAHYLLLLAGDFDFEGDPDIIRKGIDTIIAESPQLFTLVYETPRPFAKIYRIDHAP